MNIKHRMILLLTGCFWMFSIQAQTVRAISVAQGKSYTDHISLKPDSKDQRGCQYADGDPDLLSVAVRVLG